MTQNDCKVKHFLTEFSFYGVIESCIIVSERIDYLEEGGVSAYFQDHAYATIDSFSQMILVSQASMSPSSARFVGEIEPLTV